VILSVLDQSPVREGGTPGQAIRETVELARATERLGYHRYWLAEHHSSAGLAGAAPEVLVTDSICYDFSARVRSYELIAEAFGLTPRQGS
jgi:hypothetical protein